MGFRTIGLAGIALLKADEGARLKAYDDATGRTVPSGDTFVRGNLTIGYGHTGSDVVAGLQVTQERAEELLLEDVGEMVTDVNYLVAGLELNQNQFDALVCFAYNCGSGALKSSTLLKKVKAGDFAGASLEFAKWNKSGSKVLPGLTKRRADEAELFNRSV